MAGRGRARRFGVACTLRNRGPAAHSRLAAHTLDALQQLGSVGDSRPVGYYGLSQGGEMGIRLVAAEPRIKAAVLGLVGSDWLTEIAAQITTPVEFVLQWDDEGHPRESVMKLFDALGSAEKTLHANPGGHQEVPSFEIDSSVRFFARHLGAWRRRLAVFAGQVMWLISGVDADGRSPLVLPCSGHPGTLVCMPIRDSICAGLKNSGTGRAPANMLTNSSIAFWFPAIAPSSSCISGGGGVARSPI
jgi:hypothetical protein